MLVLVLVLANLVMSKLLYTFGKVLTCITDVLVSKHKASEENQTHAMGEGAEKRTPVYTTVCSIVPFHP